MNKSDLPTIQESLRLAANMETLLKDAANVIDAEMTLADDLAAVLNTVTTDEHAHVTRAGQLPEVNRVLARYQEARQQ